MAIFVRLTRIVTVDSAIYFTSTTIGTDTRAMISPRQFMFVVLWARASMTIQTRAVGVRFITWRGLQQTDIGTAAMRRLPFIGVQRRRLAGIKIIFRTTPSVRPLPTATPIVMVNPWS